ncbi:MAG: ATP-binding cassette domain-containing protein [Clostridia bacterium]|nr:ATP-binding cassette domain-containing protein [Clostridia bacterium]
MLDIKNLTKVFGKGTVNEKVALTNLSLHLNEGDFVTVIGGNGAGKSTLLNCIAGVFAVDEGSITINGMDVTKMPEHKRARFVSRVFQDPLLGTAADMQIEENLAIASQRGQRRGLGWNVTKKDSQHLKEVVATLGLGLENRMTTKVNLLSGGQRQALTLLMATMNKPSILLLDEHTAALDPKTAQKVLDLTRKITTENNQTTIMITHNMKDAITYGNKLIMMSDGKIIFQAEGEQKQKLTVADLLEKFQQIGDENDRILLS